MPTLDYFPGPPPPRHDNRLQWGCLLPGAGMMGFGVLASFLFHRGDQYVTDAGGGMCMFALGFLLTVFVIGMIALSRISQQERDDTAGEDENSDLPEGFARK